MIGLAAPSLIFPTNHSNVPKGLCNFQWSAVPGATNYLLQIWIIFNQQPAYIFDAWVGNVTSKTITLTGTGGPVYWTVAAFDGTNYSLSATWDFTVVEGVAGAIVEKKLNYGGTDYNFGVTVPLNTSASVKITIRNDSPEPALLKLVWIALKPDGSEAQYYEQQAPYLIPGELFTFQGGSIILNPAGTWSIRITLTVWDGSAWVVVASWPATLYGTLCVVGEQQQVFQNLTVTYS